MPAPLSIDLRERIIDAINNGMSHSDAAEHFDVSKRSVTRLVVRERETGSVNPKPMGGARHTRLEPDIVEAIEDTVEQAPDATLEDRIDAVEQATGKKPLSSSTMSRALRKLGLTRKKKTLRATERDREDVEERRHEFRQMQAKLDPERLIFVDETGSNIAMTPTHAWAPSGERTIDKVPRQRGKVLTIIAALRLEGLCATMTIEGGTDTAVFLAYVEHVLVPELRPGDIVLWDNLGAHQDPRLVEMIEAAGGSVIFLPPYSPELDPIEEAWSKVKHWLRRLKARSHETLNSAIATVQSLISEDDARGWFEHAGYHALVTT